MDIRLYKNSVSVIIPTYNRLKSLLMTINSLINTNNSYFIKEIIIINDKSTEPHYYLMKWKELDSRINFITNKENTREKYGYPSAGHNRKLGQKIATGDFIAFCDDDDAFYPYKLFAQLAILHQYPKMVMTGTLANRTTIPFLDTQEMDIYKNTQEFYKNIDTYEFEDIPLNDIIKQIPFELSNENENLLNNQFINSSILYRRILHDNIGYVHALPNGQEDYNWNFRCVKVGDCAIIQQHLLFYDETHGGNVSYNLSQNVNVILDEDYIIRLKKMFFDLLTEHEITQFLGKQNYIKPVGLATMIGNFNKNIQLLREMIMIYNYIDKKLGPNYLSIPYKMPNNACGLFNPLINHYSYAQDVFSRNKAILQIENDYQSSTFAQLITHPNGIIYQYNTGPSDSTNIVLLNTLKNRFPNNLVLMNTLQYYSHIEMIHFTMKTQNLLNKLPDDIMDKYLKNVKYIVIDADSKEKLKECLEYIRRFTKFGLCLNVLPSEKYFQVFLYNDNI